ncbi:EF-hand domain-containing protein [Sphingomonas sp.]|uniref:EF-hand domain-containing protein n=1 Tax=Sphingomonas sp. TaxID=28214 RepID=UPI002EDAD371
MISAPVLAQEVPAQETSPVPAEQPAQSGETPAPAEQPAETAQQPQEATPAQPAAPAEQPAQTAEQQPAPAQQGQQPANATQIAAVVDQGFPTYDKDADGSLKAEEFNSWMVALRSASEPAFKGESAADKQWLSAALAQADKDKSGSVNKDELKTFLTPAGAS